VYIGGTTGGDPYDFESAVPPVVAGVIEGAFHSDIAELVAGQFPRRFLRFGSVESRED
jgi:hypothetical protein